MIRVTKLLLFLGLAVSMFYAAYMSQDRYRSTDENVSVVKDKKETVSLAGMKSNPVKSYSAIAKRNIFKNKEIPMPVTYTLPENVEIKPVVVIPATEKVQSIQEVPKNPFPKFSLKGIMINSQDRRAAIQDEEGKTYILQVWDKVKEAQLVTIGRDYVVISFNGEDRRFDLH